MGDKTAEFYQAMQMANALASQQSAQQLQLAITAKTAQLIMSGNGGTDIAELLNILKNMSAQPTSPPEKT